MCQLRLRMFQCQSDGNELRARLRARFSPSAWGATWTSALLNFNDMKSRRDCSVGDHFPLWICDRINDPQLQATERKRRVNQVLLPALPAPFETSPTFCLPSLHLAPISSLSALKSSFVQFLITFSYKSALDIRMQHVGFDSRCDWCKIG